MGNGAALKRQCSRPSSTLQPSRPGTSGPPTRPKSRPEWQRPQSATCSKRYLPRAMRSGVMGTLAGDTGAWAGLRKHRNDSPPIIDTTITVNTNIRILFTMAFQSSSCYECVTDVSSLCRASRTSAARSPMMTHGAIVLPVVTRGIMEPSAIRRFSMPWTLSS